MTGARRTFASGGLWLLAGLVATAAFGPALFSTTEESAGFYIRAIHQYDTLDYGYWSYYYDENARSRYGAYYALGFAAPGSTVIVPEGDFGADPLTERRLYSFSNVARVVRIDGTGAPLLGAIDPKACAIASGPAGSHGPAWWVCTRDASSIPGDPRNYVNRGLKGEAYVPSVAREFLMVRFETVDSDGETVEALAFVDTSLLNADALEGAGA